MKVKGVADTTIVGGKVVWRDNQLLLDGIRGQYIPRTPHGYAYERIAVLDH
jgi:hypothetical protein